MNCKQGDLAYVFKSQAGNYGRVVTCLKLHPAGSFNFIERLGAIWEVDKPMKSVYANGKLFETDRFYMADSYLRPLYGDLITDKIETPIKEIV
jgi:hypothetical protein